MKDRKGEKGMDRKKDTSNDYVPRDYEDLYRYYIVGDGNGNSLAHKLIRSMLKYSTEDERETLSHDVFVRLLEHKMLEKFDHAKSNFGGVIYFTTRTIVVNHLARKGRNPLTGLSGGTLVSQDPEEGEFEPGTYNLDRLFGSSTPDNEGRMDAMKMLKELFAWAKDLQARSKNKRDESIIDLLNLLAEERDLKECGEVLGVTTSTVHNWMGLIRDKARELAFV